MFLVHRRPFRGEGAILDLDFSGRMVPSNLAESQTIPLDEVLKRTMNPFLTGGLL